MKRFENFSFAYAWQVVVVIVLFGISGRSEDERKTNTISAINGSEIKVGLAQTPASAVKVPVIDLSDQDLNNLNRSNSFSEKVMKEFSVKFNTIGINDITIKKP